MKAGKYYIGDPCYVLGRTKHEDWLDILDRTNYFDGNEYDIDGYVLWGTGTAHGDGEYSDRDGNSYPVDAGIIACVPIELVEIPVGDVERHGLGAIHEFDNEFECSTDCGVINIGHVSIDTDPRHEEE